MNTPTPRTAHPFKMSNQVPPVIPPLEPHGQSARCAVAMGSAWWATPRTNQEDKIIRHYCDISWQERYDLMRDACAMLERELAALTAERDQLRDSSALSEKQRESVKWWVQFFSRRRFPQRGMFFIVPGDDPGEAVILHAHSGRKMDFRLDRGETWAQSRQIFEAALPHADEVALPAGTNPDEAPLPNVKAQTRAEDGR